jgi:hypothetical protein
MTSLDTVAGTTMEITCARDELNQKLSIASRGVSTRTAVQILGGILLRAGGGRLELAATDMEISLRVGLDAEADGEGSVVVPGRLLTDIIRRLSDAEGFLPAVGNHLRASNESQPPDLRAIAERRSSWMGTTLPAIAEGAVSDRLTAARSARRRLRHR